MALKIKDTCINCSICEFGCPNQAITEGPNIYEINRDRCTQCVGHYDVPECQELCPIDDCIVIDEQHPETPEELLAKYHALTDHENT